MTNPETEPEASADVDLAALPPPRRPFRRVTFFVMGLTALFALKLSLGLRGELAYAFRAGAPSDLGDLGEKSLSGQAPNAWVRAEGTLSESSVVRYSRPLESDSYRLTALAQNPKVWVELRVPRDTDEEHFVAPGSFVGRLVPARGAGLRYRALGDAAAEAGHELPHDAWLLIDGESPSGTRWVWGVQLLLMAFAAFNVAGIVRLARPVRDA
ncbi:MAG: hypothetical protein QM756_24315 [Polyangiaceae bacterium]